MNSEEEFYDAETGLESDEDSCEVNFEDAQVYDSKHSSNASTPQANGVWERRKTLPAPMISRCDYSVWGILKKCIGMELSKITMPIVLNEPLSFLQRMSEYMEHTHLIHKACTLSDSIDRMQVVAAFAVSSVASQWDRTGKPFNPLLGETYELTREDEGYRLISEQVSHHPPISAFHAQSLKQEFEFHGSIYPKLKFWGKSVEAEPKGTMTLELLKRKEAFTWTNPLCCVHNIIMGKLWIEQYGTVEIVNHHTGDRCVLNFKPCGMFGKELHKVEGYIQDKSGFLMEYLHRRTEAHYKQPSQMCSNGTFTAENCCADYRCLTSPQLAASFNSTRKTPVSTSTVKRRFQDVGLPGRVPLSSVCMYNFTGFTITLNELEPGMERLLAPTDCRLRPDIRAMENGDLDTASVEKDRLEEKQRAARKECSKDEEEWSTRWFRLGTNPHTGAQDWLYTGGYFDRNYTDCPNLY
ncbi:unnamed protein product [Oncorhynchus mykiss]|uniref:Oxysterol-binding protein n=1 Tax=Oncorhynchus mykiss TaxID=8022 RepID=A0A060W628_ONCMY|nr:unnamed protein product [Oncorhynchus mykiss]